MTLPVVRETRMRDRRGIYHRRVWVEATGSRALVCERRADGMTEVSHLPEDLDEWQLCETCYPRRDSDVPA